MSDSPSLAVIRRVYESRMAPEVTKEVMAPDFVWDITPGFPNSGVYHGWESVATDFFGKTMPNYESFGAVPEEFYADETGHVFVYGHYHAETKTGNTADVRFLHLWTVRDGQVVRMRQIADSHVLQEALKG
ncbi:nuclear transport factor 2 family protein [Streptomyces spinoverrucosus]|uniref:nuclear transport factor 2 family protein n=1 Tax=Streptomyces spinoverrucosus TaxID=284043 RepID=UPI0018C3D15C|nr:nuclear transport factor 2 family protein [Streptomyces spinoverrucosus]MBG0854576.1 nuclear transport factor 2 family protein [Streptomyces spinoverrucosus]